MANKKNNKNTDKKEIKKTTQKKNDKVNVKEEIKENTKKEVIKENKKPNDYEIKKKENKKRKRTEKDFFSTTEVLIIAIIALGVGLFSGTFVTLKTSDKTNSSEIQEFIVAYNSIINNYYKKVNKTKLIGEAIKGMFSYLDDPHTIYMDEEETASFNQTLDGEYKGIGATIQEADGNIRIVGLFKNSPAEKAGLKEGDLILKVNGTSVEGKTADEAVALIKSKSTATLIIKRDEEEITYKIKLEEIQIPSVESEIIERNNQKVGVITMSVFAKNTGSQFKSELKKLEDQKINSLIIDVRGNSGGYLDQASEIISNFMDSSHVIYQVEVKGKKTKYYSKGKENKKYKVVVLVNGGSASASEILAAAFKESYGSDIVGTKTYGKGTVQTAQQLESGSSIKYTIESWLTPTGKSINEKGITPTFEVELDENYYDDPKAENDNQLQSALDIITKSN